MTTRKMLRISLVFIPLLFVVVAICIFSFNNTYLPLWKDADTDTVKLLVTQLEENYIGYEVFTTSNGLSNLSVKRADMNKIRFINW